MSQEVSAELKTIHDGIVATQKKADEVGEQSAETKLIAERASKDVIEAMEKVEALQNSTKYDELVARMGDLETANVVESKGADVDSEEYSNEMARYLRKGTAINQDVVNHAMQRAAHKSVYGGDDKDHDIQMKTLAAGSGPDGGYYIQSDRSAEISRRIFETSPMRNIADVQTTNSDVYEIVLDDDEAAAEWVGEVSDRDDTKTAKIGVIKFPVHELSAKPKLTQKVIDDSGFDIEGWHQEKVTRLFGRKENTAFTIGDGAEKPRGFTNYEPWAAPGVYQRDAVERITSENSGAMSGDDLIRTQNALFEEYQNGARWTMKRQTFTEVMVLKDLQGAYLMNPMMLKEGTDKILLGAGVTFFSDMANVAANADAVAFANWQDFYVVVDRFGTRVLRDPYSAKPFIQYYSTKRVTGGVKNFQAGKILRIQA